MAAPTSALCKLRINLNQLSHSSEDIFAAMVRRIDQALIKREEELQWLFDASKGGNVRGITEDRRFEFADELREVRKVTAEFKARALGWLTETERHGVNDHHGVVHPDGRWAPDWEAALQTTHGIERAMGA